MASCVCSPAPQQIQTTGPVYGGYVKVPQPHQIPERPSQQPPYCSPHQPPCYTESPQNNCPPKMQYATPHLEDRNLTLADMRHPKNCYCSPTPQKNVPSPRSNVFMPSKCASPKNLLPEEPLPPKEPDHYKGMPAYCSYLENNKTSQVPDEPVKERELQHTSHLKVGKYCPKKPCICIPPLTDTNTKPTEVPTSGQKWSCNETNQYYFPEQKYALEKGSYSDPQTQKSCSPYEGSEKWGTNAFKRPDFMKIEDQAQKFYGNNATTCLQKCPEDILSQSPKEISRYKVENHENKPSTCIEQCPAYKTSEYRSDVCDEAARLENERTSKIYKEFPQHEHCKLISRELPDNYPQVLCYCPYEGSEKWGTNAFKRPDFMKIEDQAQKFYRNNATTCLQKCPRDIPSQSPKEISKYKVENHENKPSTCIEQCPAYKTSEYRSDVCDEAARLENERTSKIYKEFPQHEHCKLISRELPDNYPQVLCYCPLEKHQKSAGKKEKICSHNTSECMCFNFTPGIHAIKEIDRAKRCPNGKPDCICPASELKDIDQCTGDVRKMDTLEQSQAMPVDGGRCNYVPESDPLASGGPIVQPREGITCYCPEVSPHAQTPMYIPQPENRTVDTQAACQPAPCVCDTPPCQQQPQKGSDPPCYLPQAKDKFPQPEAMTAEGQDSQKMGVIGPWATGRVDWGPLSGLTGTRPVVDKYSISRYSEREWRKHNADVLGGADKETHHANIVDFNGRQCAAYTAADTDKKQIDNTKRLSQRAHDVHRSKFNLERAIISMADEINLLELQRQRLKTAMGVLRMPESIAGECLDRRTGRLEPDLVRDKAEEELIKEVAMIGEIRDLMERMLKQMEEQLKHDKAIKQRTEMDWSDKKEVYAIEALNVGLRNTSTTLLFKPGATRFPEGQSTPESWEHYTNENLGLLQAELDRSIELRHFLESFLSDMARDLRMQADRVDAALTMRIAETDEVRQRLENELIKTLRRIVDTEKLIADMKQAIRNQDAAMKKAQTRLDNRLLRPRQESCRDVSQFGLVNEVKSISESVAALKAQLQQAEESLQGLLTTRGDLEREIIVKRKTLYIDRDRCQEIRSHYPSTVALTGH